MTADAHQCLFCGEPELVQVHEIWGHEFMLDTCCEGMLAAVSAELASDPKAAAAYMNAALEDQGVALPQVRRVADNDGQLILDYQLRLVPITFREMAKFVTKHHRHCPPPRGWRFGMGIVNGSQSVGGGLLGVVSCGRPVARMLDQERIVEVNRLCIDPTLPSPLVWNAASMLYGWAAKEAKRRGAHWAITYTLETEQGTSLRAAGWTPGHIVTGRNWDTPSRRREPGAVPINKVRWHRALHHAPISLRTNGAQV